MIKFPATIFDYVNTQEREYQNPVTVFDNYSWSMKTHIKESLMYKISQFVDGNPNHLKPFKNIVRPILNLQYRTEGFDVKDIELFVNDLKNYFKSFLVRKFHEKWARENKIDTFIDDLVESYVDYGGVLVKKVSGAVPEVTPMTTIAFCDQTDILSGPLGLKHFYSPSQLKDMEKKGWKRTDDLITLSDFAKVPDKNEGVSSKTPGKYAEIYEVHGQFPLSYLDKSKSDTEYEAQMHIIAFYRNNQDQKQGITLFSSKEKELPFKFLARDKIIKGRALGFGGVEELFDSQMWTNYSAIQKKNMLEAASKTIMGAIGANSSTIANKNKLRDLDNLEILDLEDGDLKQIDTYPRNIALFEKSVEEWENHAQRIGAATDPLLGESPASGTPFRLQERVVMEGKGLHEYRRGKIATFVDEIYKDWIIPHIVKEIQKGQEFLSELSLDELQTIAENVVENETSRLIKDRILAGELVFKEEVEDFKIRVREQFMKEGNKRFIKILEKELESAPVDVKVNIVGKQFDLAGKVDKLVNVFKVVVQNPAILQNKEMSKLFNSILESSGLSPIDYGSFITGTPQMAPTQMPQQMNPLNPQMQVPQTA